MKLTPAQLAALASGASLESQGLTQADAAALEAAEAEAKAKAEAEAAEAEAKAKAEAEAKAAEEAKKDEAKPDNTVVTFLTAQLSEAQGEIVNSRVTIAQLQAQVTEMKTTHEALLNIARASVGRLQVALGGSGESAATLDATSACAEHAKLNETFAKRYPVGGAAKAKSDEQVANTGDPIMRRRVALTPAN